MGHPVNCPNCHMLSVPGPTVACTDYWTRTSRIYESWTLHANHTYTDNGKIRIHWLTGGKCGNSSLPPSLFSGQFHTSWPRLLQQLQCVLFYFTLPVSLTPALWGKVIGTTTLAAFGTLMSSGDMEITGSPLVWFKQHFLHHYGCIYVFRLL